MAYGGHMVGRPLQRAKLDAQAEQLAAALARIKQLEARGGYADMVIEIPRILNDTTRDGLVREMLGRADEGASLDEIAAAWNISSEELQAWCEYDVTFGVAAGRARTRARSAILTSMRRLLEAGRGVPGAFSDRMLAMHDKGLATGDGAAGFITVDLAHDVLSCPHCGLDLAAQVDRPSDDGSDGKLAGG